MSQKPEAPPRRRPAPDVRDPASLGELVEIVNGRKIRKYFSASGRLVYTIGGVGFYHLDEARLYAKGVDE
jgi:hypothetical protein